MPLDWHFGGTADVATSDEQKTNGDEAQHEGADVGTQSGDVDGGEQCVHGFPPWRLGWGVNGIPCRVFRERQR